MKVEKRLEKLEVEKLLNDESLSKSERMKKLFLGGLEVKEISELFSLKEGKLVRYNFVYNVVSDMIRRNDLEKDVIKVEKENRKDDIVKLIKDKKSMIEISKILKCNYNYVWKIYKEYESGKIK
jgi:hypothetical protein